MIDQQKRNLRKVIAFMPSPQAPVVMTQPLSEHDRKELVSGLLVSAEFQMIRRRRDLANLQRAA